MFTSFSYYIEWASVQSMIPIITSQLTGSEGEEKERLTHYFKNYNLHTSSDNFVFFSDFEDPFHRHFLVVPC